MRKTLPLLLLVVLCNVLTSEGQIAFSREYGGAYNEDGRWVEQLADSGFIMTGGTVTYSNGQTDIWLVRTDAYGNVLWTKSIGGTQFDFANMVKPIPGGYVVCGVTNRNGDDDAILIKTDLNGNTIWEKVIGGSGIQWFEGVIPTTDGGYTCVGVNTGTGTHGTYDIWLVKFDASGGVVWDEFIGGQSYEIGNSVQQTADGGYILSGQTYSFGDLDGDYYLVKTDATGQVQWQQTYGRPKLQECHYAQITPDGGYILVGDADTLANGLGGTDIWVIKTDSLGNEMWDKIYGGTKKDGGKTIENTTDGGYIIGGITRSFNLINPNYYLIKTNGSGTVEWEITSYGTSHHDHGYRAIETSDFGYAMFGYFKNASNNMNFALVKLGPNGGVTKDIGVDEIIAPQTTICRSNGVPLSVLLTNYGATNEIDVQVNIEIDNGTTTTILTDTFVGSLAPGNSAVLDFDETYDFNLDGNYTLKAYTPHRSADISYVNDSSDLAVTVIPPTADPIPASGVRCSNGSLTLTSAPAAPADSMFWYDDPTAGDLVSSGNSYTTPSLSSTTSYYVKSIKGKGSMTGMPNNTLGSGSSSSSGYLKFDSRKYFKLVSVVVYPLSSGNRTIELRNSGGSVLQSKTFNLPTAPGGIRVYLDFDVPEGNDYQLGLSGSSSSLFRNSSGAAFPYSISQTVEIYGTNSSNLTTYYYFYDWYIFVPSENCESNRVEVQAIIGSGSTTAFDGSRCGTGTVTLTANSNSTVDWYAASSGGSSLHTGSSFTTPSISTTTTYYVEASGCANRIAVNAVVNSQSAPPTSSNVSNCGPGSVTLTATSADPVSWYNAPTNGTLMHSGSTFNTPYLNTTTIYYAVAGLNCPSSAVAVSAIINSSSAPTVTGASACGPASVTLTAVSPNLVSWFAASAGGSPIGSGSSFTTPVLSAPVTYYAQAGGPCPSPRVPVTANITVVDPPVGNNASRCGAGTVVLSAQSLTAVTWWTQATGGTQVGSGFNFTTPSLSSTTTYYAQTIASGCTSQRTPVTATVNITTPPSVTAGAHCGPGTVTLTASASDTIYWFSAASGGSPLANGTSYTTPSLTTTTTYYAQAKLSCPSVRVPVVATISSTAADPVTTDGDRCGTGSVSIAATSPDPITWYDAPGGNVVGTGSPFSTPSISSTTTYYAVAGITGCYSSPVAAIATVNALPAAPVVTGDQNCGPGLLTLSASASDPITWYSAATGGTILGTGTTYSAVFNTTTTVYAQTNNANCSSARIPVAANIYSIPVVNLGPDTLMINSGQNYTLDAGAGFTTYSWSTGATTRTISINTPGVYIVTVTNANGCQGTDTITALLNTGIEHSHLDGIVEIFPNPVSTVLTVKVNQPVDQFDIRLFDVTGRLIISDRNKNSGLFSKEYDLSRFAEGVYILQINSEEGSFTRQLIVQ